MEIIADREQRLAMESDPRQGLIGKYLDNITRDKICLMELWCKCLGQERRMMKRNDAFETYLEVKLTILFPKRIIIIRSMRHCIHR